MISTSAVRKLFFASCYGVSTPVEWEQVDDVIVGGKMKTEDIDTKFPKGHKVIKPCLRTPPQPDLS